MENQEYKKMVLHLDAGFAGMDAAEFWKIPTNAIQNEIDRLAAWERALDHAEMYGIYPESDRPDGCDEEEDGDSYSDNIEGYFEDYDPEKHDGLRDGGDDSWQEY